LGRQGFTRWTAKEGLTNNTVLSLYEDRSQTLWAGTLGGGLNRIIDGKLTALKGAVGFGAEGIQSIFEDREGSLWFGTLAGGVTSLRDGPITTISKEEGLASDSVLPVYQDKEGNVWIGSDQGLERLKDGKFTFYTKEQGLPDNLVLSVTQDGQGNIWAGTRRGVAVLKDGQFQAVGAEKGLPPGFVMCTYTDRDGDLWVGTRDGLSHFDGKRFTTYTIEDGLSNNFVRSIYQSPDRTFWIGTDGGLSRFDGVKFVSYRARSTPGLVGDTVFCLFEDSMGVLWIGTSNGLASLHSGRIRTYPEGPGSLHKQILGLAEDKNGWLWVAASNRVLRIRRDKSYDSPPEEGDIREYGTADGLRSNEPLQRSSSVVRDSLGRIWFSMTRGLSVVEPSRLVGDSPPAIVHLEAIAADGTPLSAGDTIRIPVAHKRVTFTYTGLSLAVPQRVRFRYFLDGFDRNWSEPTAAREAVYTNLNPGPYRFRVVACNSDGLWNASEAAFSFRVDPAFWQTWWFTLMGAITVGLAILTFLRLRVLSLTRQMNIRLEERVGERTRIARELHDSLLQGFQGLMFRLQAVRDLLPARPAEAIQALESALDRGDQVIAEGRGTVEDLRSSTLVNNDLVQALSTLGEELAVTEDGRASKTFRVLVEGKPRGLEPILRDEVYRIAREALRNAFHHSQAQKIEAELTYADSQFLLRIRDDGKGIDAKYLDRGSRAGHWGLPGMRERAKAFGGRLEIWSQQAAGTEVELTVPASIAYRIYSARSLSARTRFAFFRKKA